MFSPSIAIVCKKYTVFCPNCHTRLVIRQQFITFVPRMKKIRIDVVGLSHNDVRHRWEEYISKSLGRRLTLQPQPDNIVDSYAVRAREGLDNIGYVAVTDLDVVYQALKGSGRERLQSKVVEFVVEPPVITVEVEVDDIDSNYDPYDDSAYADWHYDGMSLLPRKLEQMNDLTLDLEDALDSDAPKDEIIELAQTLLNEHLYDASREMTRKRYWLEQQLSQRSEPELQNIARQLRELILPQGDFTNFGNLANNISVEDIKDTFDTKLSEIVKTKHDEKAESDNKVLGLNILTQLQQKLTTEDAIKEFATKIVSQSGVYLKLNADQMQLHLRNNEGNLSPTNPASINKKAILVSIPSPDDNEGLKRFADRLEHALKNSFNQSTARTSITVNRKSPRKDELSIITLAYCFPMRAIDWMSTYQKKYEDFLHTGNPSTDMGNAILLHSEGDGSALPQLFAVENAEEIAAQAAAAQAAQKQAAFTQPVPGQMQSSSFTATGTTAPPPAPSAAPPMPPMPAAPQPDIKLFIAVNGQQYGPYNMELCRQMVQSGQLTAQSTVWMEGLASWMLAGQVPALQSLFAPQMPPATPGMPPLPPIN